MTDPDLSVTEVCALAGGQATGPWDQETMKQSAYRILHRIWDDLDAPYVCLAEKDWHADRPNFHRRCVPIDDWPLIYDWYRKRKLAGIDIYASVCGFSKPRALKEYTIRGRWLYADLDEVDPHDIDLEPTIAIESSRGRFVGLWEVSEQTDDDLNRRLTHKLCRDKTGHEGPKVLRLIIGARNHKYDPAPRVRLLWDDGPTHRRSSVEKFAPPAQPVARPRRVARNIPDLQWSAADVRDAWDRHRKGSRLRNILPKIEKGPVSNDRSLEFTSFATSLANRHVTFWDALMLLSVWEDRNQKWKSDEKLIEQLAVHYDRWYGEHPEWKHWRDELRS